MEYVRGLLDYLPDYAWGIAAVITAVIAAFFLWRGRLRASFRKYLNDILAKPHKAETFQQRGFSVQDVLRVSGLIDHMADKNPQAELPRLTGADDIWIDQLSRNSKLKWVKLVLKHTGDLGLFSIFLASLKSGSCAAYFQDWLQNNGDLLALRRVALAGKGELFNGRKALDLLSERIEQVREMAGDPEWASRYMALKVLLHDPDERSKRAQWEAFHDPHSLIRRTIVEEFRPDGEKEEQRLYEELLLLLTDDFVFEVRQAAKKRISQTFQDRYTLDTKGLSTVQILHILEQLDARSDADRNFALSHLAGSHSELQLPAARFLERTGTLVKLFKSVDLSDRTALQRSRKLLNNAARVNVIDFLSALRDKPNPATLLIASDILQDKGAAELIFHLVGQAARLNPDESPDYSEIFNASFACACARGNDAVADYVAAYIIDHHTEAKKIGGILEMLTGSQPISYVPVLMDLLKDPSFQQRTVLHEALVKFNPSFYQDELIDIISADRDVYPHAVRISAFQVLGMLGLPCCLQTILEHLPILPPQNAREFAVCLAKYNKKDFVDRVLEILKGDDGKVRAAVIASIPATEEKNFVKPTRDALNDADPQVRSSAVWALLEYGDARSVKEVREKLRDPVESVRRQAARALAEYGNESTLAYFKELCTDEYEVESVKLAAVEGLRLSNNPASVNILVEYLKNDLSPVLSRTILKALSEKTGLQELSALIEQFKDSSTKVRSRIMSVFEMMGMESEEMLVELLRKDIASLRPYITKVLEETGFIEHTVRKLSHRDAEVRVRAAELLSLIGTAAAFRGIVLASRDPDEGVRVMVTRALERLGTKEGNKILEKLKQDPDRKIRKYTLWALERIQAKVEKT